MLEIETPKNFIKIINLFGKYRLCRVYLFGKVNPSNNETDGERNVPSRTSSNRRSRPARRCRICAAGVEMIALIIGVPSATGVKVFELRDSDLAKPVSHLKLVQSLPVAKGEHGMVTVAEFCASRGATVSIADMNRIGRRAASLSRKQDLQPVKVPCQMFGEVNSYRADILALAYEQIEALPN